MKRRYFDWASTAIPEPFPENLGDAFLANPSSAHLEGRKAREALEDARARCAAVLGTVPDTVYFTSGATESNAIVIHSFLLRPQKAKLLYSAAEHPSVRENCAVLQSLGYGAAQIEVEKDGRVSGRTIAAALEKHKDARFAAIMMANNEIGSITDIAAAAKEIRNRSAQPVHLHSDLVQAAGKMPLNIAELDLDSASISGHKIGALRGIGILYLKKPIQTLYSGGGQEKKSAPARRTLPER